MATKYRTAPEVERIAEHLIQTVPEHFGLERARIEYVLIDPTPKRHGREVLGRARRVTGLPAYLAAGARSRELVEPDPLFVVEIAAGPWAAMTDAHRRALVDHELCHCVAMLDDAGELVLSMAGHDVEEFRGIVERHGIWTAELADLFRAGADQLSLLDVAP